MLRPQNVPQHAPLSWTLHRGEWILAALPPIPAAAGIIVCGDIPLATLSVKSAYRFLLAQDIMRVQPHPLRPLSDLPAVLWPERWLWIAKSPLPIKVRQTVWRRWHNKLYLGPEEPSIDALSDDDPDQRFDPKCPYDGVHIDSPAHFVHWCPAVARSAQQYLAQCWRLWAPNEPPVDIWLTNEWSPRSGWMVAFACLAHALYAGRMHRLDPKFAALPNSHHLIYVLYLFRKFVSATVHAALGIEPAPAHRLEKLGWPASWLTFDQGIVAVRLSWPPPPPPPRPLPLPIPSIAPPISPLSLLASSLSPQPQPAIPVMVMALLQLRPRC